MQRVLLCRMCRSLQKVCTRAPHFGKPAASEKGLTSLAFSVAGMRPAAPLSSLDSIWALQPSEFPVWLRQRKAWLWSGAAGWLIMQLFPTRFISPLHSQPPLLSGAGSRTVGGEAPSGHELLPLKELSGPGPLPTRRGGAPL